jgi:hypothetical protein
MGSIKVWNGTSWVEQSSIKVYQDDIFIGYFNAKNVWAYDGLGWEKVWPNVSTVSVTGPTQVLSSDSGSTTLTYLAPVRFTITLSDYTVVSKVELQFWDATNGWAATWQTWNNPTSNSLQSNSVSLGTRGTRYARSIITLKAGGTVTSSNHAFTVSKKTLTIAPSTTTPLVGSSMTISAGCADDCPGWQVSSGWYYSTNSGASWTYHGGGNPLTWAPGSGTVVWWTYRENFADGSYISAPHAIVSPSTHYHEVVPSGSSRAAIQAAMDRAYTYFVTYQGGYVSYAEASMACVELPAGASYTLDGTSLKPRRGVRLIGGGSGGTRPLVTTSTASHIFNCDNNGGGGYNNPHYDWLVENIRFNCNNYTGGFSIVHTRRFRINGCEFSNLGGGKHYIEANSSGGARTDGSYTIEILNSYFTMTNTSPANSARRTEDECIQLDYSWPGAASNTANDGTVTNNVRVSGCTFYRVPRAVGGHRYQAESGNGSPKGVHANVYIDNNTFTEVNPVLYGDGANSANSEGAVRAYMWSYVRVIGNVFNTCYQPFKAYIPSDAVTGNGEPRYTYVASNTLQNCTSGRPAITASSAHSSLRHEQVLVESNIIEGTWSGSDFVVDIEENGTETLPASTFAVVIRWNTFRPSNLSLAEEKAYNKFSRNGDADVYVYDNYVSDGTVDNS